MGAAVHASPAPLGTKIIRNALFSALRYALVAPIPFIMTPLILHKIGVLGYGTWAVFLAINGLTSLADLGLVGTVSKFVAEYYAHQDFPALARLLNSGLAMFLLLAVFVGTTLWLAAPELGGLLFRGSTLPKQELIRLFRFFLLVIAANILSLLFSSVTTGLQRLDLTNAIGATNVILSAAFGGILLLAGWGLRALVYGYIASGALTVFAYGIAVRRLLPEVKLNPLRFDTNEAKKMFGFSLRLYVTQAAVAVHNQVEKVFLAMLVGVAPVGWYDIASDISVKVRGAIGFILTPVLPAASELSALGDQPRTRELYYRTHKYLALIGVPSVCYVVTISHRFIELWIGPSMAIIAAPLGVLAVVSFVNLATGPGFLIFAGAGNLNPGIRSAIVGIVLNVVLSLGLIYKYGFPGAVMGTAASLVIASCYFIGVFHRDTGYGYGRLLRESYLKPVVTSVLVLMTIVAVHPTSDLSWAGLITMGLLFGVVYSLIILFGGFFDDYDWSKIEAMIPGLRHVRKVVSLA